MIQKFHPKKISFKKYLVTVSMTVAFAILLSIGLIFYTRTIRYINDKLDLMEKNRFYSVYLDIDESIQSINRMIEYLQNSEILMNYLNIAENAKDDVYKKSVAINDISKLLTNAKEYSAFTKRIFIITQAREYSNYSTTTFSFETIKRIRDYEFEDITFFCYGMDRLHGIELRGISLLDENMFFAAGLRKNKGCDGKILAILDESFLYDTKQTTGNFYIVDRSGDFIWPTIDNNDISNQTKKQISLNIQSHNMDEFMFKVNDKKVITKKFSNYNWFLVYPVNDSIINQQKNSIIFYMFISFLSSIILTYIFSRLVSNRILKPIKKLTSVIGEYDGKTDFTKYDIAESKGIYMRDNLILYFIISIVIPVIIFIVMFNVTSFKHIEAHTLGYYRTVFDKTADRIDKYIERKLKAMQRITYSISIQQIAARRENAVLGVDEIFNIITENSVLGHERDIISIYNNTRELLFTNYYMGIPDFNNSFYEKMSDVKTGVIYDLQRDRYNRYLISIGMPIFYQENSPIEGYIKQDIDNADILQLYLDLINDNREAYISDYNGIVISSPKIDIIGKYSTSNAQNYNSSEGLINVKDRNSNKLLFYKKIRYLPWYLNYEVDYSIITGTSRELIMNNIFIFIIVMLFVIIMAFIISNEIMKPLGKLNSYLFEFDPAKTGEKNKAEFFFIDEISTLGSSFNKMSERIEELIDELIVSGMIQNRLEGEKKTAEIIALQAQINPHFLYNTLDMINYLVKQNKTDDVVMLINSLSDLFRFGISREEILIPIDEELKYTMAYTRIISVIYGDRIRFIWNVDNNIRDYKTIRLILQPIVENAIYHGLKKREGRICITCSSYGEFIIFEVSDNGSGMDNVELENIKENLEAGNSKKIGLYNVYSRLKLHFGEKVEFTIVSNLEEGTSVRISIPKFESL
ncbi:MAG TPA: histidine kinase [Clostridiales bacterium]|nr:histidine kinase [Clostridiales bacterium]